MYKKVFSAAILASAAMAMTSCSSSKNAQNENATKAEKITEAEAARPSAAGNGRGLSCPLRGSAEHREEEQRFRFQTLSADQRHGF